MRKLRENEEFVKDENGNPKKYNNRFYLIRVACPNNESYLTTIDDFESKDVAKVDKENNSKYDYLGFYRR